MKILDESSQRQARPGHMVVHSKENITLRIVHSATAAATGKMSQTNKSQSSSGSNDESEASGHSMPPSELELLARLEEANRVIESDAKSLNSLSGASQHSRKNSSTSITSMASSTSLNTSGAAPEDDEDSWTVWGRVVNNWESYSKKTDTLKELVNRGVPTHFRAIVWQMLCHAEKLPEKKLYGGYLNVHSPYERQIRRDISRTYPEHEYFRERDGPGQEALFNVIKAYALLDREVGYCQGTAFIIGLLLMHMPEEEAFAVTIRIMQKHGMREMFKPPMALVGLCLYQLEGLINEHVPELIIHFNKQNILTSMYASSWFLTLYTTVFSMTLSCRIMDVFLYDGLDIIFQVAVTLLMISKNDLLALDMEGIQTYMHKELPLRADADPDAIMNTAVQIKLNHKKMKKMEKEYSVAQSKENEQQAELRKLRSENRSLRCVLDSLELESASLAEKLVRFQVEAAKGAETEFALQQKLEEAEQRLKLVKENQEQKGSTDSSLEYIAISKEEVLQRDEMIQCLQQELVRVRLLEAENDALMKVLRNRISELETDQKALREVAVDNSVAHLQEELIAVKMREAEANLSLKVLRQNLTDLSVAWDKHLEEHKSESLPGPSELSTSRRLLRAWENRSVDTHKLEEDLMTARIRETDAVSELKILRLKVMELETQVQVSYNHLKRQDIEKKKIGEELEDHKNMIKSLTAKNKEMEHKLTDAMYNNKYDNMLANIKSAEDTQKIAELSQEVAQLQRKNQEILTEGEIRNNLGETDTVTQLQDQISELKAEVLRLKTWKSNASLILTEIQIEALNIDIADELDVTLTN